jgi:hypothetical protein
MTDAEKAAADADFAAAVDDVLCTLRRLPTPTRRADALLLVLALSAPWDGAATVRAFGWGWERDQPWASCTPAGRPDDRA